MQSGSGGGWKASLAAVLAANNRSRSGGSVASFATREKRSTVLYAGFRELRTLGYKLEDVRQFRGKHMEALAKAWESRGLFPARSRTTSRSSGPSPSGSARMGWSRVPRSTSARGWPGARQYQPRG